MTHTTQLHPRRSTSGSKIAAITLLALIFIAIQSSSANAQWTSNGNNINNTNTGNVGIGTSTPGALLEINKAQNAVTSVVVDNGYTTSGNAAYSGFFFRQGGTNRFFFGSLNDGNSVQSGGPGAVQLWNYANGPMLFSTNNIERMRIDSAGNVGIGTVASSARLHVIGANGTSGATAPATLTVVGGTGGNVTGGTAGTGGNLNLQGGGGGQATAGGSFIFSGPGGGVNLIGGTGGAHAFGVANAGPGGAITLTGGTGGPHTAGFPGGIGGNIAINGGGGGTGNATGPDGNVILANLRGKVGIGLNSPLYSLDVNGGPNSFRAKAATVSSSDAIATFENASGIQAIVRGNGNVGLGTTAPDMPLTVRAGAASTNGINLKNAALTYSLFSVSSRGSAGAALNQGFLGLNDAGVSKVALDSAGPSYFMGGNVGIGTTTPNSNYKLDVNGSIYVSGNINAKYQDVAEWVPATHALPPGTVVTLDPTKSNHVEASSQAYDTRVAGVISAQPGIVLGERGENKVLVATTGRVRVKVDATRSPIRIGDLLVTGDTPGVAMKSEPITIGGRQMHSPGTLIGKALEPLERGRGEILVLLSLQ